MLSHGSLPPAAPPPLSGQLASAIELRRQACSNGFVEQLHVEGKRINEVNWAEKELVRRTAQEQKDTIDRQVEAAMLDLDQRRNNQVLSLHHSIYNQRSEFEQQATKNALDYYVQFEGASANTKEAQVATQMPPALLEKARLGQELHAAFGGGGRPEVYRDQVQEEVRRIVPLGAGEAELMEQTGAPPMPPTWRLAGSGTSREISHGSPESSWNYNAQAQGCLASGNGVDSQHLQPQLPFTMAGPPAMQAPYSNMGLLHRSNAMPTATFGAQPASSPQFECVELLSPHGVMPPGSPDEVAHSPWGNTVQVLAEDDDSYDEYGRLSKKRVFTISGMDGEPLAIVQMLQ